SRARYARHASSVPNFASSSARFLGYSSTTPTYYLLGSPESSEYPSQTISVQSSNRHNGRARAQAQLQVIRQQLWFRPSDQQAQEDCNPERPVIPSTGYLLLLARQVVRFY